VIKGRPVEVAPDPAVALPDEMQQVPTEPRSRAAHVVGTLGPPAVVFTVFLAVWYAVSYLFLDPARRFLLPPPHQVFAVGFLDTENLTEILIALWDTTKVAMTGFAIAIGLGTTFAILMSQARWIERSFYPYAVVIQTIPILAIVPLIGFWFGFNFNSRVIVCVIISLFPIITNTLFGIHSVDRSLHDLFTLHGSGRLKRLVKLQLPHALPAIFTGFRISAGLSVIGAIVGEFFFRQGSPGVGRLLDVYRASLQSELLFSTIFWSSLLGVVVFWGFGLVGHLMTRAWMDTGSRTT
jgi:NitT/TauT family transport system permease protein